MYLLRIRQAVFPTGSDPLPPDIRPLHRAQNSNDNDDDNDEDDDEDNDDDDMIPQCSHLPILAC